MAVVASFVAALAALVVAAGPAAAAPRERVEICHRDASSGDYRLLTVADAAVTAHEDHGDGVPGGPVPGMDATFDETCAPVVDEDLARAGCFEARAAGYFFLTDGTSPQYLPDLVDFYSDPECTTVRTTLRSGFALVWEATQSDAVDACIAAGGDGIVAAQGEPDLWSCN
ncbi:hypothetical protein [Actinospongicola halichondriae]|uniref:hypothetical protein n=1 Tax=Actinospongicola halichondriae TaxID=3236844 RepID=UPI003D50BDA8